MKIGILLPIAETDSGTILRYTDIRDAALQAERRSIRLGLDRRPSPIRVGRSTARHLGRLDDPLGARGGDNSHRARHARHLHGIPQSRAPGKNGRRRR